ncbi:MAG TPA: hypothetical protein VHE12_08810 [bacterium]|nr:hypothetical protein [bacterium]
MKNFFLLLPLLLLPMRLSAYQILFYYNSHDGTEGGLSQCVSILQRAGHRVTPIDVQGEPYDPTGDRWEGAYDQVWDMRFVDEETKGCGKTKTYSADHFDAKWRAKAIRYLDHCGKLFLAGEHYQLGNRNEGLYRFLKEIQAVKPDFDECPPSPLGNSTTDSKAFYKVHGLKGVSKFYGAYVGGIPMRMLNGTSFGDTAQDWDWDDQVRRSFLNGWKGDQLGGAIQVPVCGEERLFMVWDATMWTLWQPGAVEEYNPSGPIWDEEGWFNYDPGHPPKGNLPEFEKARVATKTLFPAIADWLGPKVPCPCAQDHPRIPATRTIPSQAPRSPVPPGSAPAQSQLLPGPPRSDTAHLPVTLILGTEALNIYMRFLDGPGHYRLEIHDAWGAWVKTVYDKDIQLTRDDWATWDGNESSGRIMPAGLYQAVLFKDSRILRKLVIKKIGP